MSARPRKRSRRQASWFGIVAAVVIVVVIGVFAVRGRSPRGAGAGADGGGQASYDLNAGIVYAVDREPTNFNVLTPEGSSVAVLQIVDRVWPSAFHADPGAAIYRDKDLLDSAELVGTNPQTVVYKINHKATWQDGVAFSADDFIYNWQAQSRLPQYTDVNGGPFDAAGTAGYGQIASIAASPDKFTVTTTYSAPFADWKSLFSPIAPAHIMSRFGWNKGLLAANVNAQTFISAGPFTFSSYTVGRDFVLRRNPRYWGPPSNLASVDFRFIPDSPQLAAQLASRQVNAAYPQPQLDLVNQLRALPNVKLDERPGLQYEHLDFNEANPFLADVNLRKAIAMSIDRTDLIAKTVGQFSSGIGPDNNHIFAPGQPEYRDNSAPATGAAPATATPAPGAYDRADPAGARRLLTDRGYTIGGTPPVLKTRGGRAVTLRIASTQGKLRNAEEAYVINALAPLGITVTQKDTLDLQKTLSSHDFDMIIFAWTYTPFPSENDRVFQTATRSSGDRNYVGYSNKAVDSLIGQADGALDRASQADLYNQVDALLWSDMVALPLFQKPTLLVYQSGYRNLVNNTTSEGPAYNMSEWGLSK